MCCGKGAECDGVPQVGHHRITSPDPGWLHTEAAQVSSAQGRGDSTAAETRSPVALQSQEVPWFFAWTRRPEGLGAIDDNTGELATVPRFANRAHIVDEMLPWVETHPTVIRPVITSDDGLGEGAKCR